MNFSKEEFEFLMTLPIPGVGSLIWGKCPNEYGSLINVKPDLYKIFDKDEDGYHIISPSLEHKYIRHFQLYQNFEILTPEQVAQWKASSI